MRPTFNMAYHFILAGYFDLCMNFKFQNELDRQNIATLLFLISRATIDAFKEKHIPRTKSGISTFQTFFLNGALKNFD